MTKKIGWLILMGLFGWYEASASDAIGIVVAIQGTVTAQNQTGVTRSLERRSEFYVDETIVTSTNGAAQLKLNDNTILSLKPDTKYRVSDFKLDPKNPNKNSYVGNLVEGVLITMSGQGKNSTHEHHLLKTPVVTVAIRGTLYESGIKFYDCNKLSDKKSASRHKTYAFNKSNICKQATKNNNVAGIGWVHVAKGKLKVTGHNLYCDIDALDPNNNLCYYQALGTLDKDRVFTALPSIPPMMQQTGLGQVPLAITPSTQPTVIQQTQGYVSQTVSTTQQNTTNTITTIIPTPPPPPIPLPPQEGQG